MVMTWKINKEMDWGSSVGLYRCWSC